MEIDAQDEELSINRNHSGNPSKFIDTINNNISCLFEEFNESVTKIETDENSLPSPKAMLETIMPCEKLCSSFRQIADDLVEEEDASTLKANRHFRQHQNHHIKHEISEPKLATDVEDYDQFPLNLKNLAGHGHERKSAMNVS